jgi:SAM-dependent methyltransferase
MVNGWTEAPADFIRNPEKYSEQEYNHQKLTVLNMDGKKLSFDSDRFDVVFSFSSIEHFGGQKHSGALESVREMGRVLKAKGIAIVATEFILNNKDHNEYFNERTIYSDLIDKLDNLKLVEPLDLTITEKTAQTVLDFYPDPLYWNCMSSEYKKSHPHVLIRIRNIVHTSIMLVFKKL